MIYEFSLYYERNDQVEFFCLHFILEFLILAYLIMPNYYSWYER